MQVLIPQLIMKVNVHSSFRKTKPIKPNSNAPAPGEFDCDYGKQSQSVGPLDADAEWFDMLTIPSGVKGLPDRFFWRALVFIRVSVEGTPDLRHSWLI